VDEEKLLAAKERIMNGEGPGSFTADAIFAPFVGPTKTRFLKITVRRIGEQT